MYVSSGQKVGYLFLSFMKVNSSFSTFIPTSKTEAGTAGEQLARDNL
jgi:hypothetical protein